jgi:hypothetical protein
VETAGTAAAKLPDKRLVHDSHLRVVAGVLLGKRTPGEQRYLHGRKEARADEWVLDDDVAVRRSGEAGYRHIAGVGAAVELRIIVSGDGFDSGQR